MNEHLRIHLKKFLAYTKLNTKYFIQINLVELEVKKRDSSIEQENFIRDKDKFDFIYHCKVLN